MSTHDGAPFTIEDRGDGLFVLEGELDMASTGAVAEATNGMGAGSRDVVFDLAGLTFIDSSGVLALSKVADGIDGGSLILRHPTALVRRVLDLVGLAEASPRITIED